MSDFSSRFKQDDQIPEWFMWNTTKPIFCRSMKKYEIFLDSVARTEDENSDSFLVHCLCESRQPPGRVHRTAWEFLEQNADKIEGSLRRKLMAVHLDYYRRHLEMLSAGERVRNSEDRRTHNWDVIKDEQNWEDSGVIDSLFRLDVVEIYDQGPNGTGFTEYAFEYAFDAEHGVGVLMHEDRVLASGGTGDFGDGGSEVIGHLRCMQEFNFQDGDTRIDDILE